MRATYVETFLRELVNWNTAARILESLLTGAGSKEL
jgi:hypothetical protein